MKLSTVTFLALTVLCGIKPVHADDSWAALVTQVRLVVGEIQAWKQNMTKQLEVIRKELRRVERERDAYKEGLGKLAKDFVALRLQVNQTADDARSYARMRCCGMKVTKVSESSLSTTLSTMMSTRPNPATPSPAANAALFSNSSEGDLERVKQILAAGHVDINTRDLEDRTPVMMAAFFGHSDVVEFLVHEGADVLLVDWHGDNSFHIACLGGDLKTVKLILSLNKVDINCRGQFSRTPVMYAALNGHSNVVKFLVDRGADVSLVDEDGNNVLHVTCKGSANPETVKLILSLKRVDINARDNDGKTAGDTVRELGYQQVLKLLLSHGAS